MNDQLVKRKEWHTFKGWPRRWGVECALGWLNRYRRLRRDDQRQAQTGETLGPWP